MARLPNADLATSQDTEQSTEQNAGPAPTIAGVRLATAAAGIRYQGRADLVLLELAPGTQAAATFTRNAFRAAPVEIAASHLASAAPRYLLINAGNANAGTGTRGLDDALACCRAVAELTGCAPQQVLPFSTGVIGEYLPVERIVAALPGLLAGLRADAWDAAASAILTTDKIAKRIGARYAIGACNAQLTGIAKGAGMIRPDMATMLAFLATDAAVGAELLQSFLSEAVEDSFNRITIDGDTSTNDACLCLATGALGNAPPAHAAEAEALRVALHAGCQDLATMIVRDGEGATKLVSILVEEARDRHEARRVAETVAHSPLVKTALYASDPNWGRILAAVGRSGLAGLDIARVRLWLDDVCVASGGARDPGYREADGRRVMAAPEFAIRIALGRGKASMRLLTCDLSLDYVRINADYRT